MSLQQGHAPRRLVHVTALYLLVRVGTRADEQVLWGPTIDDRVLTEDSYMCYYNGLKRYDFGTGATRSRALAGLLCAVPWCSALCCKVLRGRFMFYCAKCCQKSSCALSGCSDFCRRKAVGSDTRRRDAERAYGTKPAQLEDDKVDPASHPILSPCLMCIPYPGKM